MKKLTILLLVIVCQSQLLSGQDMFPARQLTFNPAQEGFATWSPDSRFIVYQHTDLNDTTGNNGLWMVSADGTGPRQIFRGLAEHAKWSPDGSMIVSTSTRSGNFDIWIMDIDANKIRKELEAINKK